MKSGIESGIAYIKLVIHLWKVLHIESYAVSKISSAIRRKLLSLGRDDCWRVACL